MAVLETTDLSYAHSHGLDLGHGISHVVDFIAHAIAWSAVRRLVYALPGGWLLVVLAIALVVIVVTRARRSRRGPRPR